MAAAPTWQVEPLGPWPRPVTAVPRSSGAFRSTWPQTLDKLLTEIGHLDPDGAVAIRVDVDQAHIRRDGMLYSRAKVGFPGVIVAFTSSTRGPLTFATDAYTERFQTDPPAWQANLRAIALSLEALRAVDRYGVSSGREQYVGWRAIESSSSAPVVDADSAEQWLRAQMGSPYAGRPLGDLVITARRLWHPDRGGDVGDWTLLTKAVGLLRTAGRIS